MKILVEHLANYAAYHRDRRNIASHFIGIPAIVLAIAVLLSRPGLAVGTFWLSPAVLLAVAATVFYLRLSRPLGVLMGVLLSLCVWLGQVLAQGATPLCLGTGIGLFVIGWIIQFIGHYYEGRKPAFIDDLSGLIIGPLFVVVELGFLLGMLGSLQAAIEARMAQAPKDGTQHPA